MLKTAALVAAALVPTSLGAHVSWPSLEEVLRSSDSICLVRVVAVEEVPSTHEPEPHPQGHIVPSPDPSMISTVETHRSVRGDCPDRFQVRWEIPHYELRMQLTEVRSTVLLFISGPPHEAEALPEFSAYPSKTWKRLESLDHADKMIYWYDPQVIVPESLYSRHTIQFFYDRYPIPAISTLFNVSIITEKKLLDYLAKHSD